MIDPNDPTFLHMRRYNDGRVTAFVNGKELGAPNYTIVGERPDAGRVRVTVTENSTGEAVAIFQSRVPELEANP